MDDLCNQVCKVSLALPDFVQEEIMLCALLSSFVAAALVICLTLSHLQKHLQQTIFENIVAKGEIAHDEQFPLLPQCFQLFLMSGRSLFSLYVL